MKTTTADGLQIWCVELDKARAEDICQTCKCTGRKARIAKRLIRVEGIDVLGYVVLAGPKKVR